MIQESNLQFSIFTIQIAYTKIIPFSKNQYLTIPDGFQCVLHIFYITLSAFTVAIKALKAAHTDGVVWVLVLVCFFAASGN